MHTLCFVVVVEAIFGPWGWWGWGGRTRGLRAPPRAIAHHRHAVVEFLHGVAAIGVHVHARGVELEREGRRIDAHGDDGELCDGLLQSRLGPRRDVDVPRDPRVHATRGGGVAPRQFLGFARHVRVAGFGTEHAPSLHNLHD